MASSKQKKKIAAKSSSNSTILNFFARNSHSTSSTSNLQAKRSRPSISAPQEVIVIDSNSEDEQPYKRIRDKRRRLSKDVLHQENGATSKSHSSVPPKTEETARFGLPPVASEDKTSCSSVTTVTYPSFGRPTLLLQPSLSFGKPSSLLPPINSGTHFESSRMDDIVSSSSYKGNFCIDSDLTEDNFGPAAGATEAKPESVKTTHVDIDLSLDNWETGDDETEAVLNNEYATIEDDRMVDVLQACPICDLKSTDLSTSEFQTHINICLDSQSVNAPTFEATVKHDKPAAGTTNAFTKLQQSMAENEAWNESNTEWKSVSRGKGTRRKAPFYKVLQGMPIAVDAFCYGSIPGITAYFLTHAHSDHYTNLSSTWKHGPIYCSEGTSNLIIHMLSVDPKWVHPLPLDTPTVIPNTGNVSVTLIEANHCPGSSLFFFEGLQTVHAGDSTFKSNFIGSSNIFRYLHCGDFRASPQHVLHSCVKGKKIDHVYLDTTYLDPKYTFPPQALVISACAEMAKRLVEKQPLMDTKNSVGSWLKVKQPDAEKSSESAEKVLVVVGTYSIGKERIVKAIAKALNSKVYCDKKKAAILRCQADSELDALLTSDPLAAMVHVAPLGIINMDGLINYMQRYKNVFTRAIGFKPTGWCFTPSVRNATQILSVPSILSRTQQQSFSHKELRPTRNSSGSVQLIPVPYSEHSSFNELTCFAMSIDWFKIIPTVNIGSEISRKKMSMWIGKWEAERKKRKTSIVPHRHSEYW